MTRSISALTSEQLAILDLLRRAPFLRVCDLALELQCKTKFVYNRLRLLRRDCLVESVSRPSGRSEKGRTELYYVTPDGLAALASSRRGNTSASPGEDATRTSLWLLLPRLDRLVFGHALLQNALVSAPSFFGQNGRAARVRWTWIRDYQQPLPAQPGYREEARLFADWLVVVHVDRGQGQEEAYPFFIVLDHACLPQNQIRQRLGTFLHARRVAALASPTAIQTFPPLLIIVSDGHRARHWQRLASDGAREHEPALSGGVAVLSPLAHREQFPFWRLNWQQLNRYGPCSLTDLLVAHAPQSLPAAWRGPSYHWWGRNQQASARPEEDAGTGCARLTPALPSNALRRLAARASQLSNPLQGPGRAFSAATIGLLGLSLERRHYRILELLCAFPLLTVPSMAVFLDMQEASLRKYFPKLLASHCFETEQLPGDPQLRWRLSAHGLRLLAYRHHIQIQKLVQIEHPLRGGSPILRQRGIRALRQHAALTMGVYAFFTRLAQESKGHGHCLLWWETTYTREDSYYALSRGTWRFEKPHGIGEYLAGEQRVRFWLEWHGQWSFREALQRRLMGYAAYIRAQEWRREGHVLPALLLVCPDGVRERELQQLAQETLQGLHPLPIVLTTTLDLLTIQGPLGCIWQLLLSPLPEASRVRRAFYDLRIRTASEEVPSSALARKEG